MSITTTDATLIGVGITVLLALIRMVQALGTKAEAKEIRVALEKETTKADDFRQDSMGKLGVISTDLKVTNGQIRYLKEKVSDHEFRIRSVEEFHHNQFPSGSFPARKDLRAPKPDEEE